MTALRLLPRVEWEARLWQHGCKPLGAKSGEPAPETGEWWLTKDEFLFPVACDEAGNLRLEDGQQVLVLLAQLKPLDWST
jgi:hypothetical protein